MRLNRPLPAALAVLGLGPPPAPTGGWVGLVLGTVTRAVVD